MNMKKTVVAIVVAVVAIGGIAAGIALMQKDTKKDATAKPAGNSSETMDMDKTSESPETAAVVTDKVDIKNFAYSPAAITVKKGTVVTWTNSDSAPHTITGKDNTAIDSKTMNEGDTYSFKFDTVGTLEYFCSFHTGMTGTVTVTE
jgi:plastocyanin